MTNPYDTAYADGFIAGDRRAVNSSEDEIARLRAELDRAREIIAYFLLWIDPACKMGPSETIDDLKSRARAFLDKAEKQ
jgi:hypothetical protein